MRWKRQRGSRGFRRRTRVPPAGGLADPLDPSPLASPAGRAEKVPRRNGHTAREGSYLCLVFSTCAVYSQTASEPALDRESGRVLSSWTGRGWGQPWLLSRSLTRLIFTILKHSKPQVWEQRPRSKVTPVSQRGGAAAPLGQSPGKARKPRGEPLLLQSYGPWPSRSRCSGTWRGGGRGGRSGKRKRQEPIHLPNKHMVSPRPQREARRRAVCARRSPPFTMGETDRPGLAQRQLVGA